jgi:hypothetical protein
LELLGSLLKKPQINADLPDIHGARAIHYAAQMCGEQETWDDTLNIDPDRSIQAWLLQ